MSAPNLAIVHDAEYRPTENGVPIPENQPELPGDTALSMQILPEGMYAARFPDGHFHYGLIFPLPAEGELSALQKCATAPIRSRHGDVEEWTLSADLPGLPQDKCALLVPRTWLMRRGFLPLLVALRPSRCFAVRRWPELRAAFWLTQPAHSQTKPGTLLSIAA